MKITNCEYRHLTTETTCPSCGEVQGCDHGGGWFDVLEDDREYYCECPSMDSDEDGSGHDGCVWTETLDWGRLVSNYIDSIREEKTVDRIKTMLRGNDPVKVVSEIKAFLDV